MDNKVPVDIAAILTLGASFLTILPQIATVFTIVWLGLRIWETDTVQGLFKRGCDYCRKRRNTEDPE